ncbi:hypothetical protein DDI_2098 [Dickeya dianthicola RNS04.9]|nr:hypothetical protein DDI_2098 [Dickeya dianthicola RNS04.9]
MFYLFLERRHDFAYFMFHLMPILLEYWYLPFVLPCSFKGGTLYDLKEKP